MPSASKARNKDGHDQGGSKLRVVRDGQGFVIANQLTRKHQRGGSADEPEKRGSVLVGHFISLEDWKKGRRRNSIASTPQIQSDYSPFTQVWYKWVCSSILLKVIFQPSFFNPPPLVTLFYSIYQNQLIIIITPR